VKLTIPLLGPVVITRFVCCILSEELRVQPISFKQNTHMLSNFWDFILNQVILQCTIWTLKRNGKIVGTIVLLHENLDIFLASLTVFRVLFWDQVVAPQYNNYADAWETGIWKIYNVSGQVSESQPYLHLMVMQLLLLQCASKWGTDIGSHFLRRVTAPPLFRIYWSSLCVRSAFSLYYFVGWSFHNI